MVVVSCGGWLFLRGSDYRDLLLFIYFICHTIIIITKDKGKKRKKRSGEET